MGIRKTRKFTVQPQHFTRNSCLLFIQDLLLLLCPGAWSKQAATDPGKTGSSSWMVKTVAASGHYKASMQMLVEAAVHGCQTGSSCCWSNLLKLAKTAGCNPASCWSNRSRCKSKRQRQQVKVPLPTSQSYSSSRSTRQQQAAVKALILNSQSCGRSQSKDSSSSRRSKAAAA